MLPALAGASSTVPFWKSPVNYKKMTDERAVLVSAKTKKVDEKYQMSVIAAGMASVPLAFVWQQVQDFEALKKASDRVEEVSYSKKEQELYLHLSALDYHARMTLKLDFKEEEQGNLISWKVIRGHFVGMKGHVLLKRYALKKTEMSLEAEHSSTELPLPKILLGFGLEVVTKAVAKSLRSYIEDQYKSWSRTPPSSVQR